MRKTSIMLLLLFCFGFSNAQQKPIATIINSLPMEAYKQFNILNLKSNPSHPEKLKQLSKFDLFDLNMFELKQLLSAPSNYISISIIIDGQQEHLILCQNNFINSNTIFSYQSELGKKSTNYKIGKYYYGILENDPNSLVALSIFENEISGIISNANGNYTIGRSDLSDANCHEIIVYNDKDLLIQNPNNCSSDLLEPRSSNPLSPFQVETITTKCVKFYVECDYKVYTDFSSNLTNATNYATSLFNNVSTLYLNDSVSTSVSEINVWTVSDPYVSASSTTTALTLFSTQMDNNGFNGDIAHLLSRRSLGGGIAWIDILCDVDYKRTGLSASLSTSITPLPTYSWNSNVITHETGHNLGSKHTHACAWNGNNTRIDNCGGNAGYTEGNCNSNPANPAGGGTMMSYCHLISGIGINLSLGFGPQPGALIRSKVNNAACLTPCLSCANGITITSTYSTALTESSSWIVSSGQTTIASTSDVKLDADPTSGYVLFAPSSNSDFFLSSPSSSNAQFIAQTLDGCGASIPQKPNSNSNEETNITQAENSIEYKIYPNPSDGILTILNNNAIGSNVELKIISVEGKSIATYKFNSFNGHEQIDVSSIAKGFYLISLSSENVNSVIKFQKN